MQHGLQYNYQSYTHCDICRLGIFTLVRDLSAPVKECQVQQYYEYTSYQSQLLNDYGIDEVGVSMRYVVTLY